MKISEDIVDAGVRCRWAEAVALPAGVPSKSMVRLVTSGEAVAVVLVNASRGNFENHAFDLSNRIGDAVEDVICVGSGIRLDQAELERAVEDVLFMERSARDGRGGQRVGFVRDEEDPCCWISVVTVDRVHGVNVAWASGDEVCFVRQGRVLNKSAGHVLRCGVSRGPITRGIGDQYAGAGGIDTRPLASAVGSGDVILCVTHTLLSENGLDRLEGLPAGVKGMEEVLRCLREAEAIEPGAGGFGAVVVLEML